MRDATNLSHELSRVAASLAEQRGNGSICFCYQSNGMLEIGWRLTDGRWSPRAVGDTLTSAVIRLCEREDVALPAIATRLRQNAGADFR